MKTGAAVAMLRQDAGQDPWPLHHIRYRTIFCRFCTSCILKYQISSMPFRHYRQRRPFLSTAPGARPSLTPPTISLTRLIFACMVAGGIQYGWALQLSFAHPVRSGAGLRGASRAEREMEREQKGGRQWRRTPAAGDEGREGNRQRQRQRRRMAWEVGSWVYGVLKLLNAY